MGEALKKRKAEEERIRAAEAMGLSANDEMLDVGTLVVRELLTSCPATATMTDVSQKLPLHYACHRDCQSGGVVVELLKHYSAGAMKRDLQGMLPIHLACMKHFPSPEALSALIDAYPQSATMAATEGELPLHMAAAVDHFDDAAAIKVLVKASSAAASS